LLCYTVPGSRCLMPWASTYTCSKADYTVQRNSLSFVTTVGHLRI